LRPGQRVVDLGCWPGGWIQVASGIVGKQGRIVGVDLVELDPFPGLSNVHLVQGDFSESACVAALQSALGGKADVILSDAAPKVTGVRPVDRAREEALLLALEACLPVLLERAGSLLFKLFECPEAKECELRIRKSFSAGKRLRPEASRKGSKELYFYASGYMPTS